MTGPVLPTDPEDAPGGVPGHIAPDVIRRPVALPGWITAAAQLDAIASWVEYELGRDTNRREICEGAAQACRYLAEQIRQGKGA